MRETSFYLLMRVSCCGTLVSSPLHLRAAPTETPTPQVGTYFSTDYIRTLKATFSPLKANSAVNPQALELRGATLLAVRSFHEAYPTFSTEGRRFKQDGPGTGGQYSAVMDGTRILFGGKRAAKKPYIFAGDANRFVADIVFAGRYKDKNGAIYTFTDNTIELPSKNTLFYQVGLDFSEDDSDYFDTYVVEADGSRQNTGHFEFIRRTSTLVIYERELHELRSPDAAPLFELERL